MQRRYSIYEAKARLSELIRAVKRRQRVTITERGRPVAEVVPCEPTEGREMEQRLAQLHAAGSLIAARRPPPSIASIARRPGALRRFLRDRT